MPKQKSTHVDSPEAVGRRLREARERAGLSQRELAFLGCTPAYISRIEAGARIPSLQLLRELGRRLGVSADYLATGAAAAESANSPLIEAEVALGLGETVRAEALYEAALAAASGPAQRAAALEGLGRLALGHGDTQRALELLEQSAAATDADPVETPSLAAALGTALARSGQRAEAIALLERSVERHRDEVPQLVRLAAALGPVLIESGDLTGAHDLLAGALQQGVALGERGGRARLYWDEAGRRLAHGQLELAEHYADSAREVLRAGDDETALARVLQGLAHVQVNRGQGEEALELVARARPLATGHSVLADQALLDLEEARALASLGRHRDVIAVAERVLAVVGDEPGEAAGRAHLLLGCALADLGETDAAADRLAVAVGVLEEVRADRYLVQAYRRLSELLKARGDTDGALRLLEQALNAQVHQPR